METLAIRARCASSDEYPAQGPAAQEKLKRVPVQVFHMLVASNRL